MKLKVSYLKIIAAILSICALLAIAAVIGKNCFRVTPGVPVQTEAPPPYGETAAENVPKADKPLRMESYAFIQPNPYISPGDYCDVRIFFPSGENYIVMEKKQLLSAEIGSHCFQVSEFEIMKMSSALYDVNRYTGTRVYLTKYSSGAQAASVSDYPVNPAVYALCQWNPNLTAQEAQKTMNYRAALEKNLN